LLLFQELLAHVLIGLQAISSSFFVAAGLQVAKACNYTRVSHSLPAASLHAGTSAPWLDLH
jgi:hypothetical protein